MYVNAIYGSLIRTWYRRGIVIQPYAENIILDNICLALFGTEEEPAPHAYRTLEGDELQNIAREVRQRCELMLFSYQDESRPEQANVH